MSGLVEEIHHRLEKEGHALPYPAPEDRKFDAYAFVDPDWCGLLFFEMLRENNVSLLLNSLAVDVMKNGNNVEGVIVENTNGRMCVMGKVIVEATGEGYIAVRSGVPYTKVDRTKEELDPPSITFHMDGVDWDKVTAYFKANPDQMRNDRILECDSVLDLVKPGLWARLAIRTFTLKHWKQGTLPAMAILAISLPS